MLRCIVSLNIHGDFTRLVHFRDEKTGGQRGEVACFRLQSNYVIEQELKQTQPISKPVLFLPG